MTTENKSNPLAQYGPVGAPALGVVLAIVFIVAAVMTSGVSEKKDELQARISDISRTLQSQDAVEDIPPPPLTDSVSRSLDPDTRDFDVQTPAGLLRVVNHPIEFDVTMEPPPEDTFAEYDTNKDGYWTEDEWRQSPVFPDPPFAEWDRDGDGLISEAEFDEGPRQDERTVFDELDKNGDRALEPGTDDITPEDVEKWDRYPYDGKIDFDEYKLRWEPNPAREFGPVENVEAATDYDAMEIVITWEEPNVGNLADDVTYIIERRAPETVQQRQRDYNRRMRDYRDRLREWEESNFEPWYSQLSSDYKRNNNLRTRTRALEHFKELDFDQWWSSAGRDYRQDLGIEVPSQDAAPEEANEVNARAKEMARDEVWPQINLTPPTAPAPISEWEVVMTGVSGTEYRDNTFEMNVTYTYAVRMETDVPPVKAQVELVNDKPGETLESNKNFAFHDRTASSGHPVRVQNHISMSYAASSGTESDQTVDLYLETWHKVVDESASPPDHTWYRAQVLVRVASDERVGGVFNRAEILAHSGKLLSAAGDELNAGELLPAEVEVDFDTGFRFVVFQGGNVILSHDTYPQFALPRESAQERGPKDTPEGKDRPVEVRALTVNTGGRSGHFELTRWHRLDNGDWVRVVARQTVNRDDEIGMTVNLASPGRDVIVYDSAGERISGPAGTGTVDLTVGTFEGLNGRVLTIAGQEIDLFATLYKE